MAVACQEKGLLDWCICDVMWWCCGTLERANRLGMDGGAGGDFGLVIVRVLSRRWFGQSVIWVGDVRVNLWHGHGYEFGFLSLILLRVWWMR